ncbi:MAG: putative bifunctional diguanylate cyclase/phosphodiesterase [Actinomycetes bacterium]
MSDKPAPDGTAAIDASPADAASSGGRATLAHRLLWALVAMLLPVMAVVVSGMVTFQSSVGALEQFRHETVEEASVIEGLRDRLSAADDAGEAVVEGGKPLSSGEFNRLAGRIDADFDHLTMLDAHQERHMLAKAQEIWAISYDDLRTAARKSDGTNADALLDPFHDHIDQAVSALADLHAYQGKQVASEITSLRGREQVQLLLALGGLAVGLVLAVGLAWRLRRSITRPLHELETAASTFGADDFTHRVGVRGDDELARVGRAFNSMAAKLEKSRSELEHHALHDGLTGLPNRVLFMERLDHALARAQRRGTPVSVLYVDLDDFKIVNDTLGHEAGDRLLIACSERLLTCVRLEDTVARLGGDEFGILIEDTGESAATAATRITQAFSSVWPVIGGQVAVRASVGVATLDGHGDVDHLLRQADAAMYAAKAQGKGTWRIFGRELDADVLKAQRTRLELSTAIERGELVAHYQPLVDLDSGTIEGVEALVRWGHPERGLLSPAEFLDVAEQSGQVLDIDAFMLREACQQVRTWQRRSAATADMYVSVNLSAQQLHRPRVAERVAEALDASGLAPHHLVLEITESALIHDTRTAAAELARIKGLGVRLALDDFGTGYSSLSHLLRFPIDIIKIDKSFVSAIGEDPMSELALGLVKLARAMHLKTVAEGVETERQLRALRQVLCESGQGFYFAAGLPAAEMAELLPDGAVGSAMAISPAVRGA